MATIVVIKLLKSLRRVVEKAEDVVDNVESATEILKQAQGSMSVFKIITSIINMTQKKGKK
jgi:hypothetical protein